MDASFHLGRQPILDRKGELVAYELLFRAGNLSNQAEFVDDYLATAHVIQNTFTQFGLEHVLGNRLGFINFSADLLLSDVLELLPCQQVVLEILETVDITPQIIERCIELRQKGFKLALDDVIEITDKQRAILPYVQFVKLDVLAGTLDQIHLSVHELAAYPIKLLAEKIDSPELRDVCMALGFDLFQGYFFAKPSILSGQKPSPSQSTLLHLLSLVHGDAKTRDIETVFKLAPDLTVNLLKLVNSVASGIPAKIDSVAGAITVLGRRQLERWVQLLVFTLQGGNHGVATPLVQTAAIRGKLMELVALQRYPLDSSLHDKAFMVGMFSLLDALFNQPLAELISQLNLSDDVRDALLQRKGLLGQMLAYAEAVECEYPKDTDAYPECTPLILEAMAWATGLESTC
ncbi:MAG: EAL domain-containing protein [Formivibrio sp.]|nr:EAL domain-containing protein [Formivibrio sp.]